MNKPTYDPRAEAARLWAHKQPGYRAGLNDDVTFDAEGELTEEVRTEDDALLQHYARLHDGLSEMIERGRLTEKHLPHDYHWLVAMLMHANAIKDAEEE